MISTTDDRVTALESRVQAVETRWHIAAGVAAVFGITGALGFKMLSEARSQIGALRFQIDSVAVATREVDVVIKRAREQIAAAGDSAAAKVRTSASDAARNAVQPLVADIPTRVTQQLVASRGPAVEWLLPIDAPRPGGSAMPAHYDANAVSCPPGKSVRGVRFVTVSGGQLAPQVGCSP